MSVSSKTLLKKIAFYFGGDQPDVDWVEQIRSVLVVFIGLMLVLTIEK